MTILTVGDTTRLVRQIGRRKKATKDDLFNKWLDLDVTANNHRVNGVIYSSPKLNAQATAAYEEYETAKAEYDDWMGVMQADDNERHDAIIQEWQREDESESFDLQVMGERPY